MTCVEVIAMSKDVILSGVAIIGAFVAVKGLGAWQDQLSGQSDYELARRTLLSLFKYRDAVNAVRHPVMWNNEIPLPSEDETEKMSREQISHYGTSNAYQKRWDKLQSERTILNTDLLEAEVLWGAELKKRFKVIEDLEHELLTYIKNYLIAINPDELPERRAAREKFLNKSRDIMYDNMSDEDDEYKGEFRLGVENIEEYLKPKLNR